MRCGFKVATVCGLGLMALLYIFYNDTETRNLCNQLEEASLLQEECLASYEAIRPALVRLRESVLISAPTSPYDQVLGVSFPNSGVTYTNQVLKDAGATGPKAHCCFARNPSVLLDYITRQLGYHCHYNYTAFYQGCVSRNSRFKTKKRTVLCRLVRNPIDNVVARVRYNDFHWAERWGFGHHAFTGGGRPGSRPAAITDTDLLGYLNDYLHWHFNVNCMAAHYDMMVVPSFYDDMRTDWEGYMRAILTLQQGVEPGATDDTFIQREQSVDVEAIDFDALRERNPFLYESIPGQHDIMMPVHLDWFSPSLLRQMGQLINEYLERTHNMTLCDGDYTAAIEQELGIFQFLY